MIRWPKAGMRVRIRYAKWYAARMPYHDRTGTVVVAATSRRLRNALVALDGGGRVVVPGGNLFEEADR